MALTRTDKTAAASAAAFLGLLVGEAVLSGQDGADAAVEHGIATASSLRCDVRPHPGLDGRNAERVALLGAAGENSFIDLDACREYAASASSGLLRLRLAAPRRAAALP